MTIDKAFKLYISITLIVHFFFFAKYFEGYVVVVAVFVFCFAETIGTLFWRQLKNFYFLNVSI